MHIPAILPKNISLSESILGPQILDSEACFRARRVRKDAKAIIATRPPRASKGLMGLDLLHGWNLHNDSTGE
eukprot:1359297-Amorphochlora_amoeboformis.AAC.2